MKDRKNFKKGLILIEDLIVIENEKNVERTKCPLGSAFKSVETARSHFSGRCNVTITTPSLSASSSYSAAKTNSSGGLNASKCFEQASYKYTSTAHRWRFLQSLDDSLTGTQFCFDFLNSDVIKLFIFLIDDFTANI